jgi:hypothetical protein
MTKVALPQFALSVRAPWWWFILHGGKDIENRDWPTKVRGRVYIHASKWFSRMEVTDDYLFAWKIAPGSNPIGLSSMKDLGGHLVGSVEIVECTHASTSPWFFGSYGFVLRDPFILREPIPCKGALGFFRPQIMSSPQ